MTIYAFKKPPERVETLEEHIKNGIHFIRNFYIAKKYHLFVRHRLEKFGYNYSDGEVVNSILTAYAYHDIGKACKKLQEKIRIGGGAPGHEILSAVILYKHLREVEKITPITRGIILAISLHMGALRRLNESLNEAVKHLSPLPKEAIIEFNRILDDCWPKDLFVPKLAERDMNLTLKDLHLLIEEVEDYVFLRLVGDVVGKAAVIMAAYLFLHPVITADEYAVCKSQGKEPRSWVLEFLRSKCAVFTVL